MKRSVLELLEMIPTPATAMAPTTGSTVANNAYLELCGLQAITQRTVEQAVHREDVAAARTAMRNGLKFGVFGPIDLRILHSGGHYITCSWTIKRHRESGWLVATATDLTQRHELHHAELVEARTDRVTGLLNRDGFFRGADEALAQHGQHHLAMIDVDRFKDVNGTFGQQIGDGVLSSLAHRIRQAVPDDSTIGRSGGSKFIVATSQSGLQVAELGARLVAIFADPFIVGDRRIELTASIGIASHESSSNCESLTQEADSAVSKSKQEHGTSWTFASPALVAERRRELEMARSIKHALGTGQFNAWFQPVVDVASQAPVAYEALVRWIQDDGRVIPASEFIDLAADVGLIASIGREVASQGISLACDETRPRIAINLSPSELSDDQWLQEVVASIASLSVDPAQITFEVTESSVIRDLDRARQRLESLAEAGSTISLDDFGAGYSSLNYLTTLPISQVKLDRALLASRLNSPEASKTFEAIVRFVSELGHEMVVEGVETESDHDYIQSLGVRLAQGWFYGAAEPPGAIWSGHSKQGRLVDTHHERTGLAPGAVR